MKTKYNVYIFLIRQYFIYRSILSGYLGFQGDRCENDIDECQVLQEPCFNGGKFVFS